MATLPDLAAQSQQPVPQPSGGVASYEPPNWRQVGMAGQIVSSAGRDFAEASSLVAAASDHQDQIVALNAANAYKAQQLNLEQDPNSGFLNAKGNQVIGPQFAQKYQQQADDARSQIADTLTNTNQRQLFQQHAEVLGLQFNSALLQHQAKETVAFNTTTRNNTIDLGMADIAAHPYDDVTYQTNQLLMGQTVVQAGKDMGLSDAALANFVQVGTSKLDSKALLYRTNGMLMDSPMKASDFFHQHELDFDPQDRMHLAATLKTAVDAQTSRIAGGQAYTAAIGTATPSPLPANMNADVVKPYDADRITQIADQVKQPSPYDATIQKYAQLYNVSPTELKLRAVVESGMNKDAVSSQGAVGIMQFTPDTAKTYGIDPKDPEQSIAAAAQLMAKAGGTVGGDMSNVDRTYYGGNANARGPNTDQYVENLRAVRQKIMGATQPVLTQANLEGAEGRVMDNAAAIAEQTRPGDLVYRDQVQAEARKNWANSLAAIRGTNEQTVSNIMGLFASNSPPQSIGDLPTALQKGYSELPGSTQAAIQQRMLKGDSGWDRDGMALYGQVKHLAAIDPSTFAGDGVTSQGFDTMSLYAKMPDSAVREIMNLKESINKQDAATQAKGVNLSQAYATVEPMLHQIGLGKSAKPNSSHATDTGIFNKKLEDALTQYHDNNGGKWPNQDQVMKIGASLLTQGAQGGGTFWDSSTRAFQVDDPSKFYVPLPSGDQKTQLATSFQKVMGHAPTDAELQQYYTRYKLGVGK